MIVNKMLEQNNSDRFLKWKKRLETTAPVQADFEKWFFTQVSRVLFGNKSGELLKIEKDSFSLSKERCIACVMDLCSCWHVDVRILNSNDETCKIIVYNRREVKRRLQRASKKLTRCLKYKDSLTVDDFFSEISNRWNQSGKIPHEIGIALGYPLKDVWGFMGLTSIKCSGCCGWQIFGNPAPSLKVHSDFEQAKKTATLFLYAA